MKVSGTDLEGSDSDHFGPGERLLATDQGSNSGAGRSSLAVGEEAPIQRRRAQENITIPDFQKVFRHEGDVRKIVDWDNYQLLTGEHAEEEGDYAERLAAFKEQLQAHYTACVEKGRTRWERLLQAKAQYDENAVGFTAARTARRAQYNQTFQENYETEIEDDDHPDYGKQIKSYHVPEGVEAPDDEDDRNHPIAQHENYVNIGDDSTSVTADDNARGNQAPLRNSEVFWQQIGQVAYEGAEGEEEQKLAAKRSAQRKLSNLTRTSISNKVANAVLFICLEGVVEEGGEIPAQTFQPGSDEFLAILGTDNGSAIVGILLDHLDEMDNKSIGQIEASMASVGGRFNVSYA